MTYIEPHLRSSYLNAIVALNSLLERMGELEPDADGNAPLPLDRMVLLTEHFRDHLVETMPDEDGGPHVTD